MINRINKEMLYSNVLNYVRFFIISLILSFSTPIYSKEYKLGIVVKDKNTPFYLEIKNGCQFAANIYKDATCVFEGPIVSDIRLQNEVIEEIIEQDVDVLAVAPIQSELLTNRALRKAIKKNIPLITIDAPLETGSSTGIKPLAYIGSNNFELGSMLAKGLTNFREQGFSGRYIILSGRFDSHNLNLRIKGIRHELNNNIKHQLWTEVRESIYSYGKIDVALGQLNTILKKTT